MGAIKSEYPLFIASYFIGSLEISRDPIGSTVCFDKGMYSNLLPPTVGNADAKHL